jgi:hypothetical protein
MNYAAEVDSDGMVYVQSLKETGTGVQEILKLHHNNFKDCNFGITDDKDL